tara:strand:- start:2582 stop:2980 length:399 start_codon:yes stop_codon:yes gene_type:complete
MSKKYASSQYLTHKFNAMHGCNMSEFFTILAIALGALICASTLSGMVIAMIYGKFFAGFLGGFILLIYPLYKIAVLIAKKIGKFKEDKQEGYMQLVARQWMGNNAFFGLFVKSDMYVTRLGNWSTQRNRGDD